MLYLQDPTDPAFHLPMKIPNDERPEDTLPTLPHLRWRRDDALQPPQVQQDAVGRDTCGHFPDGVLPLCCLKHSRSLVGAVLFSKTNRELKLNYFGKLIEKNNVICFRRYTGRMNSFRLSRCGPRDSDYLVRSFLTMRMQKDQLFCIHKDLLLEGAIVSHVITCQGRDHVVNILSVCKYLVIVIVHFELELTRRRSRERLCLFTPHWPPYPNAVGIIMGDFNICES